MAQGGLLLPPEDPWVAMGSSAELATYPQTCRRNLTRVAANSLKCFGKVFGPTEKDQCNISIQIY